MKVKTDVKAGSGGCGCRCGGGGLLTTGDILSDNKVGVGIGVLGVGIGNA